MDLVEQWISTEVYAGCRMQMVSLSPETNTSNKDIATKPRPEYKSSLWKSLIKITNVISCQRRFP